MDHEIKLADLSFPGSRLDLLLIFMVGLFLMKTLGFILVQVWLPAALGCTSLFLLWFLSLVMPRKLSGRVFMGLWWIGLALLLVAKVIGVFSPLPE